MALRRQIIAAAIAAGGLFTLMLGWMAYCTYPVAMPNLPTCTAFLGVVLLFWWLVGSLVADVIAKQINRSLAAMRARLEDHAALRRRAESQRALLQQFTRETVPMVLGLADQAQAVALQSKGLAQRSVADDALAQLAALAEECAVALGRLTDHANQGLAQAHLLQHDLAGLTAQEAQLASQLPPLQNLARQCNLLALNAAIETARTLDRSRGVGLLTEEIKQLSTAAEAMAIGLQAHAGALREQAGQSLRTARPIVEHVEALAGEALAVNALQDEQWEAMDSLRNGDSTDLRSLREQVLNSAERMKTAGSGLKQALDGLLGNLQVAA